MPRFGLPPARAGLAEACSELFRREPVARALADHCRLGDPDDVTVGAGVSVGEVVAALRRSMRDPSLSYQVVQALSSADDEPRPDPVDVFSRGGHEGLGRALVDGGVLFDEPGRRQAIDAVVEGAGLTAPVARCLLGAASWAVAVELAGRTGRPVDRSGLAAELGVEVTPSLRPPAPDIESATIVNEVVTTIDIESILGDRGLATGPLARRLNSLLVVAVVLVGVGAGVLWSLDRRTDDGVGAEEDGGAEVLQSTGAASAGAASTGDAPIGGPATLDLALVDPLGFSTTSAEADLRLDAQAGQVCYTVIADGTDAPRTGSLRQGPAGFDGPVIVDLGTVEQEGSVCVAAEAAVIEDMMAEPGGYYLELVDTADATTIRSQLDG